MWPPLYNSIDFGRGERNTCEPSKEKKKKSQAARPQASFLRDENECRVHFFWAELFWWCGSPSACARERIMHLSLTGSRWWRGQKGILSYTLLWLSLLLGMNPTRSLFVINLLGQHIRLLHQEGELCFSVSFSLQSATSFEKNESTQTHTSFCMSTGFCFLWVIPRAAGRKTGQRFGKRNFLNSLLREMIRKIRRRRGEFIIWRIISFTLCAESLFFRECRRCCVD